MEGFCTNLAVCGLVENKKSWKNYSCFVTVLAGGHSGDRYRQLARFQNHHYY